MKMFRGRRARAERTMTIGPDGSVTLAGYSLAEALRMAKDPAFRQALREAREKPERPASMMRPVDFALDDESRLRRASMRPATEAEEADNRW